METLSLKKLGRAARWTSHREVRVQRAALLALGVDLRVVLEGFPELLQRQGLHRSSGMIHL